MQEEQRQETKLNIRLTYPDSPDWEYFTKISVIDLDEECKNDIEFGTGFEITAPKSSNKKDFKNIDGIYSSRFGQKVGDRNPNGDRYMCECGYSKYRGRINHGLECPICHTRVKYVDDDFKMFGWIILKDKYHIIHPKFYETLNYIFGPSKFNIERKKIKGTKLQNMLNFSPEVSQDGFISPCEFKPQDEPFYGIGMMEFYDRFDEILDYYYKKNPKKKDYYDEIQYYRESVFCHSIPVFTTHLRPANIQDNFMYFEPTNGIYNMINVHVHRINKDKRRMDNDLRVKNAELYKVQEGFMKLSDEILKILSGKHGQLRMLVGGRFNFSCRAVIRQSSTLRVDQVLLPYAMLVITLQQRIINILVRTYNMSPQQAYDKWQSSKTEVDPIIAQIINSIIHSYPEGLPVLINRNPTINFGSILQCYCIGFTDTLTMSVPLQAIKVMGADFDGDVLNILIIINKEFQQRCETIFNPRNAMYISKIDGKLNSDLLIQRDTLINANTFLYLGRDNYTKEDLAKIEELKKRQKEYFMTTGV